MARQKSFRGSPPALPQHSLFGQATTLAQHSPIHHYATRVSLAAAMGCLWAVPFLTPLGAGVAWFVPALLLLLSGSSPRLNTFQLGFLVGLYFHLCALYWFLYMPIFIGGLLSWFSLSAYCAIYPGLWCLFAWRMLPSLRTQSAPSSCVAPLFDRLLAMNWLQRQIWCLVCAIAWTAAEMLQSHLLTGFPWNLLGISQSELLPVIQIASVTGIYGVSFLLVWVSLSLLLAIAHISKSPGHPMAWSRELLPSGALLVFVVVFGFQRIQSAQPPPNQLRIALIQPSVNQTVIWEGTQKEERFADLLDLSRKALEHEPDLLVWPESGLPSGLASPERITEFVSQNQIPLVFNEVDATEPLPNQDQAFYNAAFVLNADGDLVDRAHKHHLVMFGEYTPFADTLPFLAKFNPIGTGFKPGEKPGILSLTTPQITMGSLICFEDAFPSLAREAARENVDFLINMTNDAWFGRSQAQWQHARAASFRAIETGLPLVRCANNGITCWIDRYGRLNTGEIKSSSDVYRKGYKIVTIPWYDSASPPPPTSYVQDGDFFGWLCVSTTLVLLFIRELFRFRGSSHDSNFDTDLLRDSV